MVENSQDELYKLENKQAKGAKLSASWGGRWGQKFGEKSSSSFNYYKRMT